MDQLIPSFFNLLVAPPGNLLYHLVVVISIGMALQSHVSLGGGQPVMSRRRMTLGLLILLLLQVLLFVISSLGWQGLLNTQVILPPLDRAFTAFSLVWIVWMWVFPDSNRVADSLVILANLVVAIFLAFTLALWAPTSSAGFNNSGLDLAWEIFSLAIAVLGLGLILARRPNGWPVGLGMMVLFIAGLGLEIFYAIPGDFPGFVRLAQLAAFPLLDTLAQQPFLAAFKPPALSANRPAGEVTTKIPARERRRYSADPKTVHAFLSLAAGENTPDRMNAITRAIGQAMLADLCLLVSTPDGLGKMTALGGYDLIREENLEAGMFNRTDAPMLATSIQKGRALRLPADHESTPDVQTLYKLIGISKPGSLLAVPLPGPDQAPWGGIILLSPYSNRVWSMDDQTYLASTAEQVAQILYPSVHPEPAAPVPPAGIPPEDIERLEAELESSRQQVQQLEKAQKDLSDQLLAAHQKAAIASQNDTFQALIRAQEEAQDLIIQLQAENEKLRQPAGLSQAGQPGATPADSRYLEGELKKALAETAQLQNSLAESNARLVEVEQRLSGQGQPAQAARPDWNDRNAAILMVIEELRRPVKAMIAQVDALLQNPASLGKEGATTAYEKLKATTDRILGLLDDLMETIEQPEGKVELNPIQVDVPGLVDQSIAATAVEFREKNLSLQVDLPETLPLLQADRPATQKALALLLHNAAQASPDQGAVALVVRLQGKAAEDQYLQFQIMDKGGGIDSPDLPRVFSRFASAWEATIKGVGSPESVIEARSLVEAQNGRIWVDTEPGSSTTFSFLLPVQPVRSFKDMVSG